MPLINYIGNRQEALAGGIGGFVRGNAPTPPSMSIDYLVVGGGTSGGGGSHGNGGCAGGFLSASAQVAFPSTLTISVGQGANNYTSTAQIGSSSISASNFGYFYAAAGTFNQSGYPQNNTVGLSNANTFGGGAGALQNGQDAIPETSGNPGLNGYGADGLAWLNGTYYAGGGGATSINGAGPGNPGLGGGGFNSGSGENGKGGGAGGSGTIGGSGVVIIRYATSSLTPPYDHAISGGTITSVGGYVYHTFTGSAQFTYQF